MPAESSPASFRPRLFVRGDVDGFFGLALDNLIQVLLISSLWTQVLGFSTARLYGRILPGVVIPMGLFNVISSLQNLDSAAAAGDDYPTVPSLLANGIGTLLGAGFGSPFPTTIYIGHPGWKALGARIGLRPYLPEELATMPLKVEW